MYILFAWIFYLHSPQYLLFTVWCITKLCIVMLPIGKQTIFFVMCRLSRKGRHMYKRQLEVKLSYLKIVLGAFSLFWYLYLGPAPSKRNLLRATTDMLLSKIQPYLFSLTFIGWWNQWVWISWGIINRTFQYAIWHG